MPLIRNGVWASDAFETVADDAALPDGAAIVSLKRFQAERESLFARNAKIGVKLASSDSPEALGEDIHRLSVIVLDFPAFRDGRGFSWARMLRMRMGYKGEIRAHGHFLADQLAHLVRVGVDSFDGDARITPEALGHALAEITHPYQPAADGKTTIRDLRAGR